MNAARSFIMIGLVGLLTGCVTSVDTEYVEPYSTPTYSTSPVYDASPAYYATPVSGYSTMTIYDDGFPVYMDAHYPHPSRRHHRPPPPPPRVEHHKDRHGGHSGGHAVRGSAHGGQGMRTPSRLFAQPSTRKPVSVSRAQPSTRRPVSVRRAQPSTRRPVSVRRAQPSTRNAASRRTPHHSPRKR